MFQLWFEFWPCFDLRLKLFTARIQERKSEDDLLTRLTTGGAIANSEELQNANRLYGRLSQAMTRAQKRKRQAGLDDLKARRDVVSKAITAFCKDQKVTRHGKMAARLLPEQRTFSARQDAALNALESASNAIKGMHAPFEAVVQAALDGTSE